MTSPNDNISLSELTSGDELLTLTDFAERMGVPVTRVGDLLTAHRLVVGNIEGKRRIPALLLDDDGTINKYASGTITVLVDGGFNDDEILTFLFTEDDSLPGRPIDNFHGHGAREVIRRAQAMAF